LLPPCPTSKLSTTAYSIYSQLPSVLEAIPPSATWGRAMPWWQGPTYHMVQNTAYKIKVTIIQLLRLWCIPGNYYFPKNNFELPNTKYKPNIN
jgi:hypothetical protein